MPGNPGRGGRAVSDRIDLAMVDVSGVRRAINIGLLEDENIQPGDWVLIHVGFALSKIDRRRPPQPLPSSRGSARPMTTSWPPWPTP